jgi:hypothetical protein
MRWQRTRKRLHWNFNNNDKEARGESTKRGLKILSSSGQLWVLRHKPLWKDWAAAQTFPHTTLVTRGFTRKRIMSHCTHAQQHRLVGSNFITLVYNAIQYSSFKGEVLDHIVHMRDNIAWGHAMLSHTCKRRHNPFSSEGSGRMSKITNVFRLT